MNLAEMVRRAAAHEAAAQALRLEVELAMGRLADATGGALTYRLPDEGGNVAMRFKQDKIVIDDQDALIGYLSEHHPEEVVEVTTREVRNPTWLKRWRDGSLLIKDGDEVVREDGRIVPGLRFVKGGEYDGIGITVNAGLKQELAADAKRYAEGRQQAMRALAPAAEPERVAIMHMDETVATVDV